MKLKNFLLSVLMAFLVIGVAPPATAQLGTVSSDSLVDGLAIHFTPADSLKMFKIYAHTKSGADTTDLPAITTFFSGSNVFLSLGQVPPNDTLYYRIKGYSKAGTLKYTSYIKTAYTPKLSKDKWFTTRATYLTEYMSRGSALLQWVNGNGLRYDVYYKVHSGTSYTLLGTVNSPGAETSLPYVAAGETYDWYVVTRGRDSTQVNSALKTFKTPPVITSP